MSEVKRYKLDVGGTHVAENGRILLEPAVEASAYDAKCAEVERLHRIEAAARAVTAHCPVNDINYTSVPTHKLRDLLAAIRLSAAQEAISAIDAVMAENP